MARRYWQHPAYQRPQPSDLLRRADLDLADAWAELHKLELQIRHIKGSLSAGRITLDETRRSIKEHGLPKPAVRRVK